MRVFTVAGAQMIPRRTIAEAGNAVAAFVGRAAARGATHLVTPEMILTGYHGNFDQRERDRVVNEVIRPACRSHGVTLCLGAGNYRDASGRRMKKPFIQVTVIGPGGGISGVHNKTIPTTGDLAWCARGSPSRLRVFRSGGLTFGVTICNDFWATPGFTGLPDINLPVLLARLGAKVVFHSIASGHDPAYRDFHARRMEERAIRAGVWVASANCASDAGKPVNAPSGIVDPRGVWTARAPSCGEHLYIGRIRG
jgi:predicted amidohydrolase